jgi:methylated-DNA-[protein]-cysteine S-methyltransferase
MLKTRQQVSVIYWGSVPSARGDCVVLATEAGVCWTSTPGEALETGLAWLGRWMAIEQVVRTENGEGCEPLQQALSELRRYFAGEHLQFSCPLDLHGTPFQISVWRELSRIPYGETRSYRDIARTIGRPIACRAVGAANGANPVAVIVPCHRVIGSDNSLTGYGGGLPTKCWLLQLEGVLKAEPIPLPFA